MLFIQLAFLMCSLGLINGKVVPDFESSCATHFYDNIPPRGVQTGPQFQKICQVYKGTSHFATLYDTQSRVPVFSAYQLEKFSCNGNQPNRRKTWYVEPQLTDNGQPQGEEMDLTYRNAEDYKGNQALNIDYEGTSYDRGHLNPNFYQCDESRNATFTLTNAVPQDPCFNRIHWNQMEETVHKILADKCSFPGAKRFLLTGATIDYGDDVTPRIPLQNDQQIDNNRDLERVAIPDMMWTAVCCDSSEADPFYQKMGFSLGYHGTNEPESLMTVQSISQMNSFLRDKYHTMSWKTFADKVIYTPNGAETIKNCKFKDSSEEREILQCQVKVQEFHYINKRFPSKARNNMLDKVATLLASQCFSGNPQKRKKLIDSEMSLSLELESMDDFKSLIPNFQLSHDLGCLPIFASIPTSYGLVPRDELRRKRDEGGSPGPLQCKIEDKSNMPMITVSGDFCRSDHSCGRHGTYYSWCYIDWKKNYRYCCEDKCAFHDGEAMTCSVGTDMSYPCLTLGNTVTVNGKSCRPGHYCGLHEYSYSWCYTDNAGSYEACCAPWHSCDYHGRSYKWCYTGARAKERWMSRCV